VAWTINEGDVPHKPPVSALGAGHALALGGVTAVVGAGGGAAVTASAAKRLLTVTVPFSSSLILASIILLAASISSTVTFTTPVKLATTSISPAANLRDRKRRDTGAGVGAVGAGDGAVGAGVVAELDVVLVRQVLGGLAGTCTILQLLTCSTSPETVANKVDGKE